MDEPRTGGMGSLVQGVPQSGAGRRLLSEGVGSVGFNPFAALDYQRTGAQTQAGGGNGRTRAARAA